MEERTWWTIGAAGLSRAVVCDAIAHLLRVVADDVARYDCDIPAPVRYPWTPDVEAAAATLLAASTRRRQAPDYGYTGWLSRDDHAAWEAFLAFAPYAYSTGAFDERMKPIASVSDEGSSVAIALTREQHSAAVAAIAPVELVSIPPRRSVLDRLRPRGRAGSGR